MAETTIKAKDGGSFMAYVAKPKAAKAPGLVLIQEIFGVNKVMRDIADDLAKEGYLVHCPDLFWRQKPGIQITDKEMDRAFELFKGFNVDKGMDDLAATLEALRRDPGCSGKVGAIGYCLGGLLAYLTATRTSVDAAVSYYGVGIEGLLGEAGKIKKPVLMHIAEKDQFVPAAAQKQITDGLKANTLVTIHAYPGCDHAFARAGGAHWNHDAAALANSRSSTFLKQHLG